MPDMSSKFIDMVLTLAIVLTVLTGFLVKLISDAQADPNLSAYAGLLGLILVIVVIGTIKYVWDTFKHR
jgi:hypothetical protein